MTVLVTVPVLGDVGRWCDTTGRYRGFDRSEAYDYMVMILREVEAFWPLMPPASATAPTGPRMFQVRPGDGRIHHMTLLIDEVGPDLPVQDIRFGP